MLHHGGIKNKSALVGNRWRTPPGSSDTDPDPWSPLQAPLDPIALPGTCPSTNQTEGVTKDLDPVRKHLEESSSQFRQGLTCFLIMVLHTYLTWQACAILPGQRLFEPNWFILLVQTRFDPESLCKLAGSHTCLNLPEPGLFKQLLTRQACTSFPGQSCLNQVGSTNI